MKKHIHFTEKPVKLQNQLRDILHIVKKAPFTETIEK